MSGMYNYKWQQQRLAFLSEHPDCCQCGSQASVVDHIKPHKGNHDLFWDQDNWQPLCKPCHDSWKKRVEQGSSAIGCDASGFPTSKVHHWN